MSQIKIYSIPGIDKTKNMIFDQWSTYLLRQSHDTLGDNVRILVPALSTSIVVTAEDIGNLTHANYLSYEDVGLDGQYTLTEYYYFIDSVTMISASAARLSLTMDTLNTYSNNITFSDRCHIIRRMKDRYRFVSKSDIRPLFDNVPEGFDISKRLVRTKYVDDSVCKGDWIVGLGTETMRESSGGDQSVKVYLFPTGNGYDSVTAKTKVYKTDGSYYGYFVTPTSSNYTVFSSVYFSGQVTGNRWISEGTTSDGRPNGKGAISVTDKIQKRYLIPYTPPQVGDGVGPVTLNGAETYGTPGSPVFTAETVTWYRNDSSGSTGYPFAVLPALTSVQASASGIYSQRTTSYNILSGKESEQFNILAFLTWKDGLTQNDMVNALFSVRNDDPKIYTSEFTDFKVEYGGASFTMSLENEGFYLGYGGIKIMYSFIPTSGTPVAFHIIPYNAAGQESYRYYDDTSGWMIPTTDLSYPLNISEFLTYMNGQNRYDKTAANTATASQTLGLATAIGAGVLSGAVSASVGGPLTAVTGGIIGGVTGAISLITGQISTWNSYNSKVNAEKQKGYNMQLATVENLYLAYENKVRLLTYRIPDNLVTSLNNLFHEFGYKTDEYGDPSARTYSRIWFDFVQCDSVSYESAPGVPRWVLDDITTRYCQGVTVYHCPTSDKYDGMTYDLTKKMLNGERSIYNLLA